MGITSRGQRTALHEQADALLESLPVLGSSQASRIVCLAHLSADPEITEFHVDAAHCVWSDTLASDIPGVTRITSDMDPASYRALYLIKVGVHHWPEPSEVIPTVKRRPGALECALGFPLALNDFAKLLVTHDADTDQLVVV